MKLLTVTPITTVSFLGIRTNGLTRIRPAEEQWKDWQITVRGSSVYVVSPPGWRIGQPREGTERQVCEIPRAQCVIEWAVGEGEKLEDLGRVAADPSRGGKQ